MNNGPDPCRRHRRTCLLILFLVTLYYLAGIIHPDANIIRHRNDGAHFHLKTIQSISENGLLGTLKSPQVPTFPLYHLILSPLYSLTSGSIWVLRSFNLVLTFLTAIFIYIYFIKLDNLRPALYRSITAWTFSLAFILSPYVRASALSVTSDNLPYLFLFSGLLLLQYFRQCQAPALIPVVIFLGFSAFYTRQFYIWVPLWFIILLYQMKQKKRALDALHLIWAAILAIPSVYCYVQWNGPVPPAFRPHHMGGFSLQSVPVIFSFIPFYFIPLYLSCLKNIRKYLNLRTFLPGAVVVSLLCLLYLPDSFQLNSVEGGGMLGLVLSSFFHSSTEILFLSSGVLGIVSILFISFSSGGNKYLWFISLGVFFSTRVFWQKYFDPLVIVILFLTLSPEFKARLVRHKTIYLFPVMEILLFISNTLLSHGRYGLP